MQSVSAIVQCPIHDSFRVQQVAGLFDVTLAEKARAEFSVELPDMHEPWQIGAIVGPSGSGKTAIARQAFGRHFYTTSEWPKDKAVIDGFGDLPIKTITHALTAVGFSSPPGWIKPYHVLSNGEQFRCNLARSLLEPGELVVFDEFTSVVDRTVGKIGSAAVAKAIRKGLISKRFVAVTCHYDVLDWLEADWVLDMAAGKVARGRLRRPPGGRPEIVLEVFRCRREAWRLFAKHHYLSADLNPAVDCYLATWGDQPVAFVAVVPHIGKRNYRRVSRIVVLPDFQGIGIGGEVVDAICRLYRDRGMRVGITTSHPAMISHLKRSRQWRLTNFRKTGNPTARGFPHRPKGSYGRSVASFCFRG